MKLILAAALALGFVSTAVTAQTVEFRGAACLTSVSASCPASGWTVGDCTLLRYSPPNLGTNGAITDFSLLGQSYADNYSLATGTLVGLAMKPVDAYHVGRTGYKYAATMRINKQTPTTLLATTASVSLTGNITNFSNSLSCNVAFRASAALRP